MDFITLNTWIIIGWIVIFTIYFYIVGVSDPWDWDGDDVFGGFLLLASIALQTFGYIGLFNNIIFYIVAWILIGATLFEGFNYELEGTALVFLGINVNSFLISLLIFWFPNIQALFIIVWIIILIDSLSLLIYLLVDVWDVIAVPLILYIVAILVGFFTSLLVVFFPDLGILNTIVNFFINIPNLFLQNLTISIMIIIWVAVFASYFIIIYVSDPWDWDGDDIFGGFLLIFIMTLQSLGYVTLLFYNLLFFIISWIIIAVVHFEILNEELKRITIGFAVINTHSFLVSLTMFWFLNTIGIIVTVFIMIMIDLSLILTFLAKKFHQEKLKKMRLEKEILTEILSFEFKKKRAMTKKEMIKVLDIPIDETDYYKNLLNISIGYHDKDIENLKLKAQEVIKEFDHPTLYDLIVNLQYDLTTAKKVGLYLIKEGWIKKFPRIPGVKDEKFEAEIYKSGKVLNAKVVLLGQAGVGKTHLILSLIGKQYPNNYPWSTDGVEIFYKPIKIQKKGYKLNLCFWDLCGQPNLIPINEIFLHDARIIILVFDIALDQTFEDLKNFYDMIKSTRFLLNKDKIFVVGNKIDVGGIGFSEKEIINFLSQNNLTNYYKTSAKTGENVKVLLNDIENAVDWSDMIKRLNPQIMEIINNEIENLRKKIKIIEIEHLMNLFIKGPSQLDSLEVKIALRQFASQKLIQISRDEKLVIIDPEFVGSQENKLFKRASLHKGIVKWNDYVKEWKLTHDQLKVLFKYLETEKFCYPLWKGAWAFPNVRRDIEIKLDDRAKKILDSAPQTMAYRVPGFGDLIFSRLIVTIAQELNAPEDTGGYASNTAALWFQGKGLDQTILLIQYIPSKNESIIRFKTGGGKGEELLKQVEELSQHLFSVYTSESHKI